eukprot:TRINITY_DN2384_c0_g3_i2.p1 TRINITY_DN2384_c0_g3~~TRINITY_DN2384_c0_g3_i2.p1  ORF type:complete len:392 (+),score=90.83 TRINITY_DN2384_c0_g3_i2:292-1467(+)
MVSTVSSLGRERMAALARLLVLGGFPEATAEEANIEKLAIQSICRELHEADEANLLNEEDMHVFDCRPLTDPLNLVCCNACKKPVKASQFAPHTERCRTLNFSKDIVLELDGGTGHKKPPRKGKKKVQTAHYNQTAIVGERERSESIDGEETTVGLNMDDQTGLASSLFREAKRDSTLMDGALVIDGSGVNSGSTNHSMGVVSPSEKRTKLIAALPLPVADCIERIYGVTTEMETSCQDAVTCVPVPLATKMYHSQRSHLRAALGHLYHEALVEDHGNDSLSPKIVPRDTALASQVSSPGSSLQNAQMDHIPQKKTAYGLCVLRKPDQTLSDSSDLCFGAASAPKNQFLDDKISRPVISVDSASTRMIRTRYHPTPYSFPGNSGTTVGTVQ